MAPAGQGNQHYVNQAPGYTNQQPPSGTQYVRGADASAKMDALKKWTLSTYKYTKQIVSEKMGKRTRTVDAEIEKHILALRETQLRYGNLLKLAKQFSNQFQSILVTQKMLGEAFTELSIKSPELQEEFNQNAELQKVVSRGGDTLTTALTFFCENLETLSTKTIDDTIMTMREYETERIQFDAYRTDLESFESQEQSLKGEEAKRTFNVQKEKFEKLRNNLQIKIKFLEENKVCNNPLFRQKCSKINSKNYEFSFRHMCLGETYCF